MDKLFSDKVDEIIYNNSNLGIIFIASKLVDDLYRLFAQELAIKGIILAKTINNINGELYDKIAAIVDENSERGEINSESVLSDQLCALFKQQNS